MRVILFALAGAGLAACSTATEPPMRSADAQAKYLRAIDGKVAGPTMNCLPSYSADDMQVIDDQTLVFRQSASRVVVANLNGSCDNLGVPGFALLTRQPGGSGMCSGDIAQVINTGSGMTAGSCVIGSFTPYTTP